MPADLRPFADHLLAWYDRHARVLPWRVSPQDRARGIRPEPYRVWLSEIMLQQTTVAAVKAYFVKFTTRWPHVADLAAAPQPAVLGEWAGLGYYARARNLHACAIRVSEEFGGAFPQTAAALRTLPGIGDYTSAAIAANAFDEPTAVVDGNVERVVTRLFSIETPLPQARKDIRLRTAELTPQKRPGDFAQAMMDLGATICTPRSPACGICPLIRDCDAYAAGIASDLPRKSPKAARPARSGIVWIARKGDALLLEERPASGLLGGTLAFPSAGWDGRDLPPPGPADWSEIGEVRHVFTHFSLTMRVMLGELSGRPERGRLVPLRHIDRKALPGLMRKVWDLARAEIAA